jgi:hypothetical protein
MQRMDKNGRLRVRLNNRLAQSEQRAQGYR